ncbi:MAG: sigma-70 family RNA polymerase sigma factor [Phycisphaerae bacterium]|nr:sigma-70 family RNA polymerase sigma factor [Gemmatimonadaceae bacterium]
MPYKFATASTNIPRSVDEITTEPTPMGSGATQNWPADVSELLDELRTDRGTALNEILPLVYHELRSTARRELAARSSDTMSPTALVHELYLKFSRTELQWRNHAHFFGVASLAMRNILLDRARRRSANKRGGMQGAVTLDETLTPADENAERFLELHEAINNLALIDVRLARVVECRFFGGLTEQETASVLGVTERTVRRDWIKARGLLFRALREPESPTQPTDPAERSST